MARMKPKARNEFALFNVHYEDGSLTSNRKVPGEVLEDFDPDQAIEDFLTAQDRQIAERSGKPRAPIKSIEKVKKAKKSA
ncbi:MAG: hypothetical protein JXQ99_02445 [Hyphomicrobiaceae bacterium]